MSKGKGYNWRTGVGPNGYRSTDRGQSEDYTINEALIKGESLQEIQKLLDKGHKVVNYHNRDFRVDYEAVLAAESSTVNLVLEHIKKPNILLYLIFLFKNGAKCNEDTMDRAIYYRAGIDIFEFLLANGERFNEDAIECAISSEVGIDIFEFLFANGVTIANNDNGLLKKALSAGKGVEVLNLLYSHGAKIDNGDGKGKGNIIDYALFHNASVEEFLWLFNHGAEVYNSARMFHPLDEATKPHRSEVTDILLLHGIDPKLYSDENKKNELIERKSYLEKQMERLVNIELTSKDMFEQINEQYREDHDLKEGDSIPMVSDVINKVQGFLVEPVVLKVYNSNKKYKERKGDDKPSESVTSSSSSALGPKSKSEKKGK